MPTSKSGPFDCRLLRRGDPEPSALASLRPRIELSDLLLIYIVERQRERLLDTAASHIQHMQKAMTEMNLQLHHVVSDITGATGMRIIRAIIAGERDPAVLASMRDTRCHSSAEVIEKALTGHYRGEHLFVLEQALALYEGGKVLSSRTRRSGSRAASLLRLAAVAIGRTETALGAF